jgi:hypothetical protein
LVEDVIRGSIAGCASSASGRGWAMNKPRRQR